MFADPAQLLQDWVRSLSGWFLYWLVPRLIRSVLILLVVRVIQSWSESLWRNWLSPVLVGARERTPHQAVFRRQLLLTVPVSLTRWLLFLGAIWLIAEQFAVPREILIFLFLLAFALLLWSAGDRLGDWFSGFAMALDDCLIPGDHLELPSVTGEAVRWGSFGVSVKGDDGRIFYIPFRILYQQILIIGKQTAATEPPPSSPSTRSLKRAGGETG